MSVALTGLWVRSLTVATRSGSSRSNDHANRQRVAAMAVKIIDAIGMHTNARFISTTRITLEFAIEARKLKYGEVANG